MEPQKIGLLEELFPITSDARTPAEVSKTLTARYLENRKKLLADQHWTI